MVWCLVKHRDYFYLHLTHYNMDDNMKIYPCDVAKMKYTLYKQVQQQS